MARIVTVPCAGAVFDVTVSVEPTSLPSTDAPLSVVLTAVEPVLFTATGVTVRDTVAVDVWPAASVAV